jgi:leucyl-tRNA synthetase
MTKCDKMAIITKMPKKKEYNHKEIEAKWQKKWEEDGLYDAEINPKLPKHYALTMLPYPSGNLHMGHWYAMVPSDAHARYMKMNGYNVMFPMGFDAFGLPAENAAIKKGIHPKEWTYSNMETMRGQLRAMGAMFDWKREVVSCDPEYYKWTQWFFIQFFKNNLAYRKKAMVDWCPSCNTTLAREQVIGENRECERCHTPVIKKNLEQWFFRTTNYAEELLDFSGIDWPEQVKVLQTNWIGKSEGAEIEFEIAASPLAPRNDIIKVFTTRPDTLFGATYMVIAPEHPLIKEITASENKKEVEEYVEKSLRQSEIQRTAENKEKTGVFTGAYAINPATKEEIPVWVADYVLMGYGTGAIMAVPAHDERDWDFAKKYKLPIREVIIPERIDKRNPPVEGKRNVERRNVHVFVRNSKDGKILLLKWKKFPWITFPMGGVEEGESLIEAAKREAQEETGYKNFKNGKVLGGQVRAEYFAAHKDENRVSYTNLVYLELANEEREETAEHEREAHDSFWEDASKLTVDYMVHAEMDVWLDRINKEFGAYVGDGILVDSGKFSGMDWKEAKGKMAEEFGKRATTYRLRDWLISRQRYWGAPIPIIKCSKCGDVAVPEKDLPVILPDDVEWLPTGESPLKLHPTWKNAKCPKCGGDAERETDTMDTFMCSSWYHLRYLSPHYDKGPFDPKEYDYWMPVDVYTGGIEHATMHLIYVRFFHKALRDLKIVKGDEPMTKLRNQGIVLGNDSEKMSKSRGNVVAPDELVKTFGADTVRAYLMFFARWQQGGPWSDKGIVGIIRWLERVWKIFGTELKFGNPDEKSSKQLRNRVHKTLKSVSADIDNFEFNTIISALMELSNFMHESSVADNCGKKEWDEALEIYALMLAPFVPHIAEELWTEFLGKQYSIHNQVWPKIDGKALEEDSVNMVVQVNGRLRDSIEMPIGANDEEIKEKALASEKVQKLLDGREPKKAIIVKNRLINIVV